MGIVDAHKIVDWHNNVEVHRRVRNDLEDYLFDVLRGEYAVRLSIDIIDQVISLVWDLSVDNKGETEG